MWWKRLLILHITSFIYHIVQIFGGEKPWQIWQITSGLSNCIAQILAISHEINEESKKAEIHQRFILQKFPMGNLPKFSSTNSLHYTVCSSFYWLKYNKGVH